MAGSYKHLKDGGDWTFIENMGDAWECVEELLYLVEKEIGEEKADKILREHFYPMSKGEKEPDKAFLEVRRAMDVEV